MASVKLSTLAGALVVRVKAVMVLDGFTELGADPRLYIEDTLPPEPLEPYGVFSLAPGAYGWDEGLEVGGRCGWPDVDVTGVARMQQAALFVCDSVRSYLRELDPATVAVGGGTTIKSLSSSAPPSQPIEAGTLWNIVETYNLYVEAS